jgi:hypothetical protein
MHMKVTTEQFVLDGDKLTHKPTGATFWMGEKDVVCCEQGRLGLETGDDYHLDELKDEAHHGDRAKGWNAVEFVRRDGSPLIHSGD